VTVPTGSSRTTTVNRAQPHPVQLPVDRRARAERSSQPAHSNPRQPSPNASQPPVATPQLLDVRGSGSEPRSHRCRVRVRGDRGRADRRRRERGLLDHAQHRIRPRVMFRRAPLPQRPGVHRHQQLRVMRAELRSRSDRARARPAVTEEGGAAREWSHDRMVAEHEPHVHQARTYVRAREALVVVTAPRWGPVRSVASAGEGVLAAGRRRSRHKTCLTVAGYHSRPPCAVGTRSSFRSAAILRNVSPRAR
jgi:hypothetical protein